MDLSKMTKAELVAHIGEINAKLEEKPKVDPNKQNELVNAKERIEELEQEVKDLTVIRADLTEENEKLEKHNNKLFKQVTAEPAEQNQTKEPETPSVEDTLKTFRED